MHIHKHCDAPDTVFSDLLRVCIILNSLLSMPFLLSSINTSGRQRKRLLEHWRAPTHKIETHRTMESQFSTEHEELVPAIVYRARDHVDQKLREAIEAAETTPSLGDGKSSPLLEKDRHPQLEKTYNVRLKCY